MAPPNIHEIASRVASMAEELGNDAKRLVHPKKQSKWRILIAGASAGIIVDTTLFPIDTIKSRLQSGPGFSKSGGFSHLYRGLLPVITGSIPNGKFLRELILEPSNYHINNQLPTF